MQQARKGGPETVANTRTSYRRLIDVRGHVQCLTRVSSRRLDFAIVYLISHGAGEISVTNIVQRIADVRQCSIELPQLPPASAPYPSQTPRDP